jgi:stage II sporulation protein R
MALAITFLVGAWAQKTQRQLAGDLVRLHVLAASDTAEEQAVKLEVRDAVLSCVEPMLAQAQSRDQAEAILQEALSDIETAARSAAGDRQVTVTLGMESYPTRYYTGFSLPAGRYLSLRVILDQGAGQNWWCVVFPPLCLETSAWAEDASQCLTEEELQIISETSEGGYTLRFRILELWGELVQSLTE